MGGRGREEGQSFATLFAMAGEALHEVTAPELAMLVLLYLQENAYTASATTFMHEAIGALRLIVPPKPSL